MQFEFAENKAYKRRGSPHVWHWLVAGEPGRQLAGELRWQERSARLPFTEEAGDVIHHTLVMGSMAVVGRQLQHYCSAKGQGWGVGSVRERGRGRSATNCSCSRALDVQPLVWLGRHAAI